MCTRVAVLVSLLLLQGCAGEVPDGGAEGAFQTAAFDDPEVNRVHTNMMEVIAPERGWERARYLEFDWATAAGSVRHHRWDRWEGRARVEMQVDGQTMVAVFDTDQPSDGRVWLNGEALEGDAAVDRLNSAYRSHINDAYWLVMPFKWTDPGVHVRYLGEEEGEDGRHWDVIELSFEADIGLTPQNMYHAFVNRETGRMDRWHHFSNPEASPSPSDWTDWRRVGPIELAEHRRSGGEIRLTFPHLRVEEEVPSGVFDPPATSN